MGLKKTQVGCLFLKKTVFLNPGENHCPTSHTTAVSYDVTALVVIKPKKHQRLADPLICCSMSGVITHNHCVLCAMKSTVLDKVSLWQYLLVSWNGPRATSQMAIAPAPVLNSKLSSNSFDFYFELRLYSPVCMDNEINLKPDVIFFS